MGSVPAGALSIGVVTVPLAGTADFSGPFCAEATTASAAITAAVMQFNLNRLALLLKADSGNSFLMVSVFINLIVIVLD